MAGLIVYALVCGYLVWAALHDIARQLQKTYVAETVVLLIAVPALTGLVWYAVRCSGRGGRYAWLASVGVWILLLDAAAWDSIRTGWMRTGGVLERSVLLASIPFLLMIAGSAIRFRQRQPPSQEHKGLPA